MELNSFLFPAPQSSYTMHGGVGEILYIPREPYLEEMSQINTQRSLTEPAKEGSLSNLKFPLTDQYSNDNKSGSLHKELQKHHQAFDRKKSLSLVVKDSLDFHSGILEKTSKEEIKQPHRSSNIVLSREPLRRENSLREIKTPRIKLRCDAIPCVYLPYQLGSSKILIYFHGNAEDIGLATELLDYIRTLLRVSDFES